jgi:hypothetical protein
MKYFILKSAETLEVCLSQETDKQPENSIPFFQNEWKRAKFDVFPNPTTVVEFIEQEIPQKVNEVALWKIRTVLKMMGLEETIQEKFELLEEPEKTAAKYIYEYGTSIERYSKTVLFLQNVLEMTDQQVDQIFTNANNITL